MFLGHNLDSRGRIWTNIGHIKATSLPDLPKPKRVQPKQQEKQNNRPQALATKTKKRVLHVSVCVFSVFNAVFLFFGPETIYSLRNFLFPVRLLVGALILCVED